MCLNMHDYRNKGVPSFIYFPPGVSINRIGQPRKDGMNRHARMAQEIININKAQDTTNVKSYIKTDNEYT